MKYVVEFSVPSGLGPMTAKAEVEADTFEAGEGDVVFSRKETLGPRYPVAYFSGVIRVDLAVAS